MSKTSTDNYFFKLGMVVAAAQSGLRSEDIPALQGYVEHIDGEEDGKFHKLAASMGALCYATAEQQHSFGHMLFAKIASSPWKPGYVKLLAPLYETFSKHALLGGALNAGAQGLQAAALVSALAGLGTGAMHWKLNKDVTQEEDETAIMQARRDEYRRVADEINANLVLHGIQPPAA